MTRALEDAELLPLADALADGAWHSGEALAAAAGVGRAALAKRVAHLADWGLEIEARAGLGYRLGAPLERLDADAIRAALPAPQAAALGAFEVALRVDSTNAQLLAADAARDPQALFAEAQTAGRGRRGRLWLSPFGANLYLSIGWSFAAWPPRPGTLSLAVGVACARALRGQGLHGVMLKWPNDLRIGEAKLGGILIEQRGEAGGACRVAVGIGLNIAMLPAQAAALDQPWTSVNAQRVQAGQPALSRNALAAAVLAAVLGALEEFAAFGFAPFLADWSALDLAAGQRVRVEGNGEPLEGRACGIDDNGALIVEAGGRRHHLHAGEVSLRLAR